MPPRPWVWALVGTALGAGLTALLLTRQQAQQAAADQATLASYRQTIGQLQSQAARLDTVFHRDTLRLRSWRDRWDTLRLVTERVDTLISVDTLRLVVRVADSTINACSEALGTCEQRTTVLRSMLEADSSAVRALSRQLARAKVRGRLACAAGPSATVVGSAVRVGYVGVSCGVRLF